ncbi:monofunctional biosynthetic peptidoglycan transglycosylase, partial [Pseudomonas sp. MPR-R2A6]
MGPGNANVGTHVQQSELNPRARPRPKRGLLGRVVGWALRAVIAFVIVSIFMVVLYR